MPSALDIRDEIRSYLEGAIDYDQFDEWISGNTWNIHRERNGEVRELVGAVESSLAEFSGGFVSEDVLRRNLQQLVAHSDAIVLLGPSPTFVAFSGPFVSDNASYSIRTHANFMIKPSQKPTQNESYSSTPLFQRFSVAEA